MNTPHNEPPLNATSTPAAPPLRLWAVYLRGAIERFNPCYVTAPDPSTAYHTVRHHLDKEDIAFAADRELKSIELLAEHRPYTNVGATLFPYPKNI